MNNYRVEFLVKAFYDIEADSASAAEDQAIMLCRSDVRVLRIDDADMDIQSVEIGGNGEVNDHDGMCLCGNADCDGGEDGAACAYTDDNGNIGDTPGWWLDSDE